MSAQGRLLAECQLLAKQQTPSVFARPDEDDILHWTGLIVGPPHSPYGRGLFHFGRGHSLARLCTAPACQHLGAKACRQSLTAVV